MRRIVVLVASACTFTPVQSDPPGTNPDAGPLKNPGSNATCHITDSSLVLCLDFEDPSLEPIARDGSSRHNDANTDHVTPMPRGSEQAMHVSSRSAVFAPDLSQSNHISVEMYASPDAAPLHDELLIASLSWDIVHYLDGSIGADFGGNNAGTSGPLAIGGWTHLAFTTDDRLRLFVNGDVVACQDLSETELFNGGQLTIGDSTDGTYAFVGGIDNVRVYDRALTTDEVCARAGRTKCKSSCPE